MLFPFSYIYRSIPFKDIRAAFGEGDEAGPTPAGDDSWPDDSDDHAEEEVQEPQLPQLHVGKGSFAHAPSHQLFQGLARAARLEANDFEGFGTAARAADDFRADYDEIISLNKKK